VIVDPQSYRIVAFVPLAGGGTVGTASSRDTTDSAAPPASPPKTRARTERKRVTATEEKPRSTDHEREAVHKDIDRRRSVHTETDVTVGSSTRPESVEIEELPPRVRRMSPPVRRYRYFEPEDRGPVVVEPSERPVFPLFDIFR
jgi:hypothetical protein